MQHIPALIVLATLAMLALYAWLVTSGAKRERTRLLRLASARILQAICVSAAVASILIGIGIISASSRTVTALWISAALAFSGFWIHAHVIKSRGEHSARDHCDR